MASSKKVIMTSSCQAAPPVIYRDHRKGLGLISSLSMICLAFLRSPAFALDSTISEPLSHPPATLPESRIYPEGSYLGPDLSDHFFV